MLNSILKKNFCTSAKASLVPSLVTTLAASLTLTAFPLKSEALTFNFFFDNVGDGLPLDPPLVGTGTFSFDGDLGDGLFALTSLPNYNFSLDFGGDIFTNADIITPVEEVLVIISSFGSDRFLNFSNVNDFGSGLFNGSIDFFNPTNSSQTDLSFEPPGVGGTLDLYYTSDFEQESGFAGNYLATTASLQSTSIPEPSSILGLIVVSSLGIFATRQGKSN